MAHLDHALLEQAAAIEIAYGPSIWQLLRNLLIWGTPLSEEEGSVQRAVPVRALLAAGKITQLLDDDGQAEAFFAEALRLYSQLGDQAGMASALYFLGSLARSQDLLRGKALLEQSLALQRAIGDSHGSSGTLCDLAMIAMFQGDAPGARVLLEEGLAIARAANNENRVAILPARFGWYELNQSRPQAIITYIADHIDQWTIRSPGTC